MEDYKSHHSVSNKTKDISYAFANLQVALVLTKTNGVLAHLEVTVVRCDYGLHGRTPKKIVVHELVMRNWPHPLSRVFVNYSLDANIVTTLHAALLLFDVAAVGVVNIIVHAWQITRIANTQRL